MTPRTGTAHDVLRAPDGESDAVIRVRGLVRRYGNGTKLGVDGRTRAVTVALERGLLPAPGRPR